MYIRNETCTYTNTYDVIEISVEDLTGVDLMSASFVNAQLDHATTGDYLFIVLAPFY